MKNTNDDSDAGGESGARKVVVGILATPNLPTRLAKQLNDWLSDELTRHIDDTVTWHIELLNDPFESQFPDFPGLLDKAHERVRRTEWDVALCLTDLPLRDGPHDTVVADLRQQQQVGLISTPALGGACNCTAGWQSSPYPRSTACSTVVRRTASNGRPSCPTHVRPGRGPAAARAAISSSRFGEWAGYAYWSG